MKARVLHAARGCVSLGLGLSCLLVVARAIAGGDAPPAAPRAPVAVYLHGMCDRAENGCPLFAEGTRQFGFLACPQANARCQGGGSSWGGDLATRERTIDAAVAGIAAANGNADGDAPTVLLGFSQGAYLAPKVALDRPGKYKAMLLIGADVDLDPASLRRAGVERVALAAGMYDGTFHAMKRTADALEKAGYPARFVSLGKVGHTYLGESPDTLKDTVKWVTEGVAPARSTTASAPTPPTRRARLD
jgi:predicted esterase